MTKRIDTDNLKRQLSRYFSFRTIQGRNVLLTTSYLLILITFTILVVYQNNLVSDVGDRVIQTRNPITVMTSRINAGLDRVSAAQRGYFLTKDDTYKDERNSLWDTDILPALEKLEELGKQLTSQDRRSIDGLGILLKEYKHRQDDLELYFEQHITDFAAIQEDNIQSYDSLTLRLKLESFKKKSTLDEYIVEYLLTQISPLKSEIREYLGPLSQQQRKAMLDDVKRINEDIESANSSIAFVTAFFAILAIGSSLLVIRTLNTSLVRPVNQLDRLSIGDLGKQIDETSDEMNEIILSSNKLRDNLGKASKFALSIGEGHFEAKFQPASDYDILGNALVQMRNKLKDVAYQDEKRNWITKGMAHFGEILRKNQDLKELSNAIISELVSYLNANQGELYFLDESEDQKYLNLEATYAFERRRIIDKKIHIDGRFGEGLLGQSYLLGETIYLNDVPEGYTEITSGLGDATPRSVLIVPLKINEEVEGVLEIASFTEIEPFEVEFVERVAESIASTLRTAKNNQRTKQLLLSSQKQRDHLRSQEEEMRQNYEELQATQEEMERRQNELEGLRMNLQNQVKERTEELEKTIERFDLALQGTSEGIWDAVLQNGNLDEFTNFWWSPRFEELLEYEEGELPNDLESFTNNIHPEDRNKAIKIFKGLIADHLGIAPDSLDVRLRLKSGTYKWFHISGAVKHDDEGVARRFAGAINDISSTIDLKESQEQLYMREANLKAFLDVTNDFVIAIDQKMVITLANNSIKNALATRGVNIVEGETVILDIVRPENREKYKENTKKALEGNIFTDEMILQFGAEKRVMDTRYYPINGDDGSTIGATVMFHDITDRKKRESDLEESRRQLKAIFDTYEAEVYMKDLQGRYIMVDQTLTKRLNLGYDIIGKTDVEIFGEEEGSMIWELDREISEQETEVSYVETRADGTRFKFVKFPMVNSSGKIYAICSIASELEFEGESDQILEKVPVSLMYRSFNDPSLVVKTTGAWQNLFGGATDLDVFVTEKDQAKYHHAMHNIKKAVKEGKSYYETYTLTLRDQSRILVLEKGNSVINDFEGSEVVISAMINITPLRPNHGKNG